MAKRVKSTSNQRIGLTGDWLLTRPLSVFKEKPYLKMREMLASTDAVFANLEAAVHPYLDDPLAQRPGGGSYMTTEPALLQDMKWMGVNLVACGSSHADDYGPSGIMQTKKYFDEAGIVHAGSGRHLAEARMPGYLDTANGRIALIAANAQFRDTSRAGDQRYDNLGHPGVNGFRHKVIYRVDRETLNQLRAIAQKTGWQAAMDRQKYQGQTVSADAGDSYNFMGQIYKVGPKFAITSTPNKRDMDENLRQVRHARFNADRVIVSLHVHDQGGPTLLTAKRRAHVEDVADYALEFGRRCIDSGADIFVAHGPQVPLAVEVYKGKPMFHGMGTFVFQIETIKVLPAEAYERFDLDERATPSDFIEARYAGGTRGHVGDSDQWQQVYAICDFAGDQFKEARIYPIDLGQKRSRTQRGRPIPADTKAAKATLARLKRLSAKYGTTIEVKGGVGIVRPE